MQTRPSLQRISQCLGLALFALTTWVFLSLAGPVEAELALPVYAVLIAFIAVIFVLAFLALRLGTGGPRFTGGTTVRGTKPGGSS